jgi:hypothetical protein
MITTKQRGAVDGPSGNIRADPLVRDPGVTTIAVSPPRRRVVAREGIKGSVCVVAREHQRGAKGRGCENAKGVRPQPSFCHTYWVSENR